MQPQTRNLVDDYIIPEKRQSVKVWKTRQKLRKNLAEKY